METTTAAIPDDQALPLIHEALAGHELLPEVHLVDAGYTDAEGLVSSQRDYGVTLLGPVAQDPSWQAKAGEGFDKASFIVDWEAHTVTCPAGKQNYSWLPHEDRTLGIVSAIRVQFASRDCSQCPLRSSCTRAKQAPRELILQTREEYEALHAAKQRQTTLEFREQYAMRAGIEATHAQGLRRSDLRQTRYIGLTKTHLQHLFTALALNLVRAVEWLTGPLPTETGVTKTHQSHFAALQEAAA